MGKFFITIACKYFESRGSSCHGSGAESELLYASDITRTVPVGGNSLHDKEIYEIVLAAENNTIDRIKPGKPHWRFIGGCTRYCAWTEGNRINEGDVDEAVRAVLMHSSFRMGWDICLEWMFMT
jgi:Xaa-Pro aminopeptidase